MSKKTETVEFRASPQMVGDVQSFAERLTEGNNSEAWRRLAAAGLKAYATLEGSGEASPDARSGGEVAPGDASPSQSRPSLIDPKDLRDDRFKCWTCEYVGEEDEFAEVAHGRSVGECEACYEDREEAEEEAAPDA